MLPPVKSTLMASSAVVALIAARVWRHNSAPQDQVADARAQGIGYVTWFLVTGDPQNTLSELPSKDRMTIQVDCWHPSDRSCEQLAINVRNAIEPYAHMTGQPIDGRDTATKLYRMALQFDWFVDRPLPEPTS